jgi:hypothetical protein
MNSNNQEIVDKKDRLAFQTSIETRLLYDRLRKLGVGEVVAYEELSEIVGQNIQKEAWAALSSARRMILRDENKVCDPLRGYGIKYLTDAEANSTGTHTLMKVRRLTDRGVKKVLAADYDNLTPEDQTRRNATLSAFSVVKLMAKPKSLDRIAAANTTAGELPIARTLELFKGPKKL